MRPRRTVESNAVFALKGGNEDNDLWVRQARDVGGNAVICSVWEPTEEERKAIAAGANVELITWGTGTPPLAMNVTVVQLGKAPRVSSDGEGSGG